MLSVIQWLAVTSEPCEWIVKDGSGACIKQTEKDHEHIFQRFCFNPTISHVSQRFIDHWSDTFTWSHLPIQSRALCDRITRASVCSVQPEWMLRLLGYFHTQGHVYTNQPAWLHFCYVICSKRRLKVKENMTFCFFLCFSCSGNDQAKEKSALIQIKGNGWVYDGYLFLVKFLM